MSWFDRRQRYNSADVDFCWRPLPQEGKKELHFSFPFKLHLSLNDKDLLIKLCLNKGGPVWWMPKSAPAKNCITALLMVSLVWIKLCRCAPRKSELNKRLTVECNYGVSGWGKNGAIQTNTHTHKVLENNKKSPYYPMLWHRFSFTVQDAHEEEL